MRSSLLLPSLLLGLAASGALALWNPYYGGTDFGDSHVQELRSFRDIVAIDRFRFVPTPTPTPPPDGTWSFSSGTFDWPGNDAIPHPLVDYFHDVAGHFVGGSSSGFSLVDMNFPTPDYPGIARALRPAGRVIAQLIHRPEARVFASARRVARRIESAVAAAPEPLGHTLVFFGEDAQSSSASRIDYRSLALAFAADLRQASRNAAAHRPLADSLPRRPKPLYLSVIYASNGQPIQIIRRDGRGRSTVTAVIAPAPTSPITNGGSAIWVEGSLSYSGNISIAPPPSPTPVAP